MCPYFVVRCRIYTLCPAFSLYCTLCTADVHTHTFTEGAAKSALLCADKILQDTKALANLSRVTRVGHEGQESIKLHK